MAHEDPPKPSNARLRLIFLAIAIAVIPIGLVARSMRGDADGSTVPGFIATYLGDTLWAVLFFFTFAALLPRLTTLRCAVLTLGVTLGIEASQLYHGEPLTTLRNFAPSRFLLGSHFLWSDIACLFVGTALAMTIHRLMLLPKARVNP